jgi:large subunit ribosomal protein L13
MEEAIRGMLPKTKMGDQMYRKLNVYERADHPHAAQKPQSLEVE